MFEHNFHRGTLERATSHHTGWPCPPPPGVSIRNTSPRSAWNSVLAGIVVRLPRHQSICAWQCPADHPGAHRVRARAGRTEKSTFAPVQKLPFPYNAVATAPAAPAARILAEYCTRGCAAAADAPVLPPAYSNYSSCAYGWPTARRAPDPLPCRRRWFRNRRTVDPATSHIHRNSNCSSSRSLPPGSDPARLELTRPAAHP